MKGGLHAAAQRALEGLGGDAHEGEVTRLTVDVALEGASELVTLSLRDGELAWTSTGAPNGPHVRAALAWVARREEARADGPMRSADPAEARVSWVPPAEEGDPPDEPTARARLAEAIEDVVTVVVRAGVASASSPSVSESLERLRREAPLPTPAGLSRWLGRLRSALDAHEIGTVARLLDGAARLVEDLRRDRPTPAIRRRVAGWLGGAEPGTVERASDRRLLEVAREQLAGSERNGIERRYLVDLANGEIFCEERSKASPVASVGPCPRIAEVGLAELEHGTSPRRIRFMQYAVSLDLDAAALGRVEETGYRRLDALADRHRQATAELPGQAEPFAVVVPARVERSGDVPVAYDSDDAPLPFARVDDPAAVEVLAALCQETAPRWIAGRLVDLDGALMMVPCSVGMPAPNGTRLHRLR